MREILFRALKDDISDCRFAYGTLTYSVDGIPRIFEHQGSYLTTTCIKGTVGQFTGLLDKNGNKIFEGDILKMPFPETYIVKFINGSFAFFRPNEEDRYSNICYWEDAEIIGNIHDK